MRKSRWCLSSSTAMANAIVKMLIHNWMGRIDWVEIGRAFGAHFSSARGRPALPPRLIAGLPYQQYFCSEVYLTEAPIGPSSFTRWRKRVGEEGVETLLMAAIEVARRGGVVKASSAERVIVTSCSSWQSCDFLAPDSGPSCVCCSSRG